MMLIGFDIDGTQIGERTRETAYFEGELSSIRTLKSELESLRAQGKIKIAHVTNGMFDLYQQVADTLAIPDYVTCDASTRIYQNTPSGLVLDRDFDKALKSSRYDPDLAERRAALFPQLQQSGKEHQTEYKRSFLIRDPTLSVSDRHDIHRRIADLYLDEPGTSVFYVEGEMDAQGRISPEGPFPTIDIVPRLCTKGECLTFIARKEGLTPDRILAGGNGDNDISMFMEQSRSIAVGNSQEKLLTHAWNLSGRAPGNHFVAPGHRSDGLRQGLRHFGLIS